VIITNIFEKYLTQQDREILQRPEVGGVILFEYNYQNISQIKYLIKQLKNLRKDNFMIAIDQEGGRVQRIKKPLELIPYMYTIGELYQKNPDQALEKIFEIGKTTATQMQELGFNTLLTPVLDLYNPDNIIIGKRAFSADPNVVIALAKQYIAGVKTTDMQTVGKHYPGHGCVDCDTHLKMPVSNLSLAEMEKTHLKPFIELADILDGVMTAHITFPKIDKMPVTFSKIWLQDLLRQKYKFKGFIMSDCLAMKGAYAIHASPTLQVQDAIEAGVDYISMCHRHRKALARVL
jgi:beta-N-acetylhexosaminidase